LQWGSQVFELIFAIRAIILLSIFTKQALLLEPKASKKGQVI